VTWREKGEDGGTRWNLIAVPNVQTGTRTRRLPQIDMGGRPRSSDSFDAIAGFDGRTGEIK